MSKYCYINDNYLVVSNTPKHLLPHYLANPEATTASWGCNHCPDNNKCKGGAFKTTSYNLISKQLFELDYLCDIYFREIDEIEAFKIINDLQ